ncbi:MAG: hypothetical protein Kilf2KO_11960 [Rhodospirillales bacterium]
MTKLTDLEETAARFAERPFAELYTEVGLPAGPTRIVARIGGRGWPPRLLLALDRKRRNAGDGPLPGSPETQALLRELGVPLMDRHLAESPLRTG